MAAAIKTAEMKIVLQACEEGHFVKTIRYSCNFLVFDEELSALIF